MCVGLPEFSVVGTYAHGYDEQQKPVVSGGTDWHALSSRESVWGLSCVAPLEFVAIIKHCKSEWKFRKEPYGTLKNPRWHPTPAQDKGIRNKGKKGVVNVQLVIDKSEGWKQNIEIIDAANQYDRNRDWKGRGGEGCGI